MTTPGERLVPVIENIADNLERVSREVRGAATSRADHAAALKAAKDSTTEIVATIDEVTERLTQNAAAS